MLKYVLVFAGVLTLAGCNCAKGVGVSYAAVQPVQFAAAPQAPPMQYSPPVMPYRTLEK